MLLDELFGFVFELIGEVINALIPDSLVDLFSDILGHLRGDAAITAFIVMVVGGLLGLVSMGPWPERLLYPLVFPGAGVFLATLSTVALLYGFGKWRETRGAQATPFDTCCVGAMFTLVFSAVRLIGVS
jgi:hypothetical protein